jgi:tocopherol O-methyltransferase
MSRRAISTYYTRLTSAYQAYASGTHCWHYGIWDPLVRTHPEALLQSNRRLASGCEVRPGAQILDVGCGVGGFAVWAAAEYGCQVTGITICPAHVVLARQLAAKRGVEDRCEFTLMDMERLTYADQRFDLVVNQETLCYAADKGRYLEQVHRVLRPGGVWRAIEFSVQEAPLSAREERWYRETCTGFHLPGLLPQEAVRDLVRRIGFLRFGSEDLTTRVHRTARPIIRQSFLPVVLASLGAERWWLAADAETLRFQRGHYAAGMAYSRGLLRGCFRHYLWSAHRAT